MADLREQLQNVFGLDDFRPAQRDVIEDVLKGRDVLCVMPTGAGKSLCYQFPAVLKRGLTIVVSPLIALMEDQVQQLQDEGIPAALLNSSLSAPMQRQVIAELHQGFEGLLYVAPERFFAPSFQSVIPLLKPAFLAIDEAHCISQWGHDFRPEYHRLGEVRRMLGSPPTIALTATATDDVREDIIRQLDLREPTIVVTGFDRPTLMYECQRISKAVDKEAAILELLRQEPTGSAIVYCATRKAVDEVSLMLSHTVRDRAVVAYHAGMDQQTRSANQERFMQTPRAIAIATNAFGMGINKPDIRLVIHYNVPGTLEAYYQEAGRAGRDGQPARCVMLFSYQDRYTQQFFIDKIGQDAPESDAELVKQLKAHSQRKLEMVISYAQTHRCRRQMILDYFGEETTVALCRCDVCRKGEPANADAFPPAEPIMLSDQTIQLIRQLLSAIARCKGRFGIGVVAEVLAGSDSERTSKWGLNELTVYGLLRAYPVKRIIAMLHRLLEAGLARQRDPDGVKFRPVIELTSSGVEVMKGSQPPPTSLADLIARRIESADRNSGAGADRAAFRRSSPEDAADIAIDADPEVLRRFERLRGVRAELAKERKLPPYCICHDKTLKAIAHAAPSDSAGLERIKGMGPYKIQQYGQALLVALRPND